MYKLHFFATSFCKRTLWESAVSAASLVGIESLQCTTCRISHSHWSSWECCRFTAAERASLPKSIAKFLHSCTFSFYLCLVCFVLCWLIYTWITAHRTRRSIATFAWTHRLVFTSSQMRFDWWLVILCSFSKCWYVWFWYVWFEPSRHNLIIKWRPILRWRGRETTNGAIAVFLINFSFGEGLWLLQDDSGIIYSI